MPLGSGASSLAWVLSAGLPRRWAVDRCQADGERDQRPRGAKADCHHRDEQPAEQRLPGGVPQPREVQERSEESEQDDHGRPHSTRVQELRRLPEIDLSGGCGRTVDCCIHGNAGTRCSRRRACGMDDLQNCDGVVARAVVLRQRCGSDPIGPFAGPAIPANAVVLARRSIHGGSASVSVASGKDDLGNYTDVPASFSSSRLRKFDSSTSPSGSTGAPMCAIHTPAGARIERPGRFPSGRPAVAPESGQLAPVNTRANREPRGAKPTRTAPGWLASTSATPTPTRRRTSLSGSLLEVVRSGSHGRLQPGARVLGRAAA